MRSHAALGVVSGLLLLAGCAGPSEYQLRGTSRAAGADGMIQIESIEGGNHMVTLAIDHLPPPARLGPELTSYAVWFEEAGRATQKAGDLEYDDDTRSGRMMATTPLRRFTVKVTAERDRSSISPSDWVVATREVGGED